MRVKSLSLQCAAGGLSPRAPSRLAWRLKRAPSRVSKHCPWLAAAQLASAFALLRAVELHLAGCTCPSAAPAPTATGLRSHNPPSAVHKPDAPGPGSDPLGLLDGGGSTMSLGLGPGSAPGTATAASQRASAASSAGAAAAAAAAVAAEGEEVGHRLSLLNPPAGEESSSLLDVSWMRGVDVCPASAGWGWLCMFLRVRRSGPRAGKLPHWSLL